MGLRDPMPRTVVWRWVRVRGSVVVTMDNMAISPPEVSAKVGDTIQWINKDVFDHTATARNGDWDVAVPAKTTVTTVLKKSGPIAYYCRFHPKMTARIQIEQ
jgi:plastocyanin